MLFKKAHKPTDTFRDRIDAALASDQDYQLLTARRDAVASEKAALECRRDDFRVALSNRMSAADEASAIASGKLSPTSGDPAASREDLSSVISRIAVLQSALEQMNDSIVLKRQETGEQLYRSEFMTEQAEVAGKILDMLLDLAATRIEERIRLHDLQKAGITILSLPRCTPKLASGMFVDEFARDIQALGYSMSEAQAGRLEGVKRAEAAL